LRLSETNPLCENSRRAVSCAGGEEVQDVPPADLPPPIGSLHRYLSERRRSYHPVEMRMALHPSTLLLFRSYKVFFVTIRLLKTPPDTNVVGEQLPSGG
jgi:hypothetical protein